MLLDHLDIPVWVEYLVATLFGILFAVMFALPIWMVLTLIKKDKVL